MRIGVISDTHGYLDPRVFEFFEDVEQILHAGDIGREDIITSLETIAPVIAVHGNVDHYPLTQHYPATQAVTLRETAVLIVHDIADIRMGRASKQYVHFPRGRPDLVIYGHSHIAKIHRDGETVLFNPGAAGKARLKSEPSVGILTIDDRGGFETQIVPLHPA
jgi:putative phosphoesterase